MVCANISFMPSACFRIWNSSVPPVNPSVPGKVAFVSGCVPLTFIFWLQQLLSCGRFSSHSFYYLQVTPNSAICNELSFCWGKNLEVLYTIRLGVISSHLVIWCFLPIVVMHLWRSWYAAAVFMDAGIPELSGCILHTHTHAHTQCLPCVQGPRQSDASPPHPLLICCWVWAISRKLTSLSYNTFPSHWQNLPKSYTYTLYTIISHISSVT